MGGSARQRLRTVVSVALMIALVFGARAFVNRGAATGPAPPVEGVTLDGTPVSLGALRGRPVLVHFWATWCPVCRFTEAGIQAIAEDYQTITIALQSGDAEAVGEHLREQGLQLPVVLDPHGILAASYGVRGVPASFVVDAAGQIRFREVGYTTELGLRARLWWSGLQAPGSSPRQGPVQAR